MLRLSIDFAGAGCWYHMESRIVRYVQSTSWQENNYTVMKENCESSRFKCPWYVWRRLGYMSLSERLVNGLYTVIPPIYTIYKWVISHLFTIY